jgi:hypothetical protein
MRLEIILILCLLILGGTIYYKNNGLTLTNPFSNASSTTLSLNIFDGLFDGVDNEGTETENEDAEPTKVSTAIVPPSISTPEIEKQVDDIYKRLNELQAEEREKEIEGSASPYAGMFTLKTASAKLTDHRKNT